MEFLVTPIMAVHLLAVNVGSACPLVCVWLRYREIKHRDEFAGQAGRMLAARSVALLWAGVALGVVAAGLLWWQRDAGFLRGLEALPARRYWFALAELLFSLGCLTAYAWQWERLRRWPKFHALLAIVASTNLLYHFPALMSIISIAGTRPDVLEVSASSAYRSLLRDGEVLSRVVHVWLASLAVTGVFVMQFAVAQQKRHKAADGLAALGAKLALGPTALQWVVGFWVLMALADSSRVALLGEDLLATALLAVALLALLGLMHLLANFLMGDMRPKLVKQCAVLIAIVVLVMTGASRRIRHLNASVAEFDAHRAAAALPDGR